VKLVDNGEALSLSLVLGDVALRIEANGLLVDANRLRRRVRERVVAADFRGVGRSAGSVGGRGRNVVALLSAGALGRGVGGGSGLLSPGEQRSVDVVVEVDSSLGARVEQVSQHEELDGVVLG